MADSGRNKMIFSGFDSAWSARNSGAICELVMKEDGPLQLDRFPFVANWDQAIAQASQGRAADLHIWAIDQPICVRNESGCRPVERDLSRALMAHFGCGAYPANLSNPCWQSGARIWEFVRALDENNYLHNPMAIPSAKSGRYYFECYPHPAVLGVFGLDRIVQYKFRHRNAGEWRRIIGLLRSLAISAFPVRNICSFVRENLPQNKPNEDKLDAIISAYSAAYWWKFGIERSTMIGDLSTGYIVTPHSKGTYDDIASVFGGRMNQKGPACEPPQAGAPLGRKAPSPVDRPVKTLSARSDELPVEPQNGWRGPEELTATDTANIWRTSRRTAVNPWLDAERMTGWRLWLRFIEEDGEPTVLFLPFRNQEAQQGGMRPAPQQMNGGLWSFLVAGARRDNPIRFQVCYCYEQLQ